jgi:hypothetical protein
MKVIWKIQGLYGGLLGPLTPKEIFVQMTRLSTSDNIITVINNIVKKFFFF